MGATNSHESLNKTSSIDVDLQRYSGSWVELARYPFVFEVGCDYVTTEYTADPVGLTIHNFCWRKTDDRKGYHQANEKRTKDGFTLVNDITGQGIKQDGKIIVRFKNNPFSAEYIVMYTDYENFSLVRSGNGNNFWLLGRRDTLTRDQVDEISRIMKKFNINTEKLILSKHVKVID